jgi:hypothetical protein
VTVPELQLLNMSAEITANVARLASFCM